MKNTIYLLLVQSNIIRCEGDWVIAVLVTLIIDPRPAALQFLHEWLMDIAKSIVERRF